MGSKWLNKEVMHTPDWQFFIFADEEAVSNVKLKSGEGLITIVRTDLLENTEQFLDDEDDPYSNADLWQKFKSRQGVEFYASILDNQWPGRYEKDTGFPEVVAI